MRGLFVAASVLEERGVRRRLKETCRLQQRYRCRREEPRTAMCQRKSEEVLLLDRSDGGTRKYVDWAVASAHFEPQKHALLAHGERDDQLRLPRVLSPEERVQQC